MYLTASQECFFSVCKFDHSKWEPCQDAVLESELTRGPANMGPARRVAEGTFLIVTGELCLECQALESRTHSIFLCLN